MNFDANFRIPFEHTLQTEGVPVASLLPNSRMTQPDAGERLYVRRPR